MFFFNKKQQLLNMSMKLCPFVASEVPLASDFHPVYNLEPALLAGASEAAAAADCERVLDRLWKSRQRVQCPAARAARTGPCKQTCSEHSGCPPADRQASPQPLALMHEPLPLICHMRCVTCDGVDGIVFLLTS